MKDKYYFFMTFLFGIVICFIGCIALCFSSSFIYFIIIGLGVLIFIDTIHSFSIKRDFLILGIRLLFAIIFICFARLPISLILRLFAIYLCVIGLSQLITYWYYQKEKVSGRFTFLCSALLLLFTSIVFFVSPIVHMKDITMICGFYMIYLGLKYIVSSMRELLSEDRKNSLKRRIRVSLPVFMVALLPRIVIEKINDHLEVHDDIYYQDVTSPLEVFVHVSKDGFSAMGHVDISYENHVIAYGAYDDSSHHLFGAIGDGVLFVTEKKKYIDFCIEDDPSSYAFGYTLYLDNQQKAAIEKTIEDFRKDLIPWQPSSQENYAYRLYEKTNAQFYKFKKGKFKHYFVMTTNCVLLADKIIGKSGIDIVNMNGIITPGSYFHYFEEEAKKENSRVLKREIYKSSEA